MTVDPRRLEDTRKIHNEVSQIVNQRFNLTTLVLIILGAFDGLLTPTLAQPGLSPSQKVLIAESVAIIELMVFALLWWYFSALSRMLRVYTTYLRIHNLSIWEEEWAEYRKAHHRYYHNYTKSGEIIFGLCGIIAFLYPGLVVVALFSPDIQGWALFAGALVALIVHETLVVWWGRPKSRREDVLMDNWREVIAPKPKDMSIKK
jgi:uncharacterized membrane protein